MNRVEKSASGCWLWTGGLSGSGYGAFWLGAKQIGAHRASVMLFKNLDPSGKHVCHVCDVRRCVNPDHLFLGTAGDNIHDAINKGRHKGPPAKIDREVAEVIRAEPRVYGYREKMASRYGISRSLVDLVIQGKAWA